MKKFELGPVQKLWVKNLKKYPNRQTTRVLGVGSPRSYRACCLGEFLLCEARVKRKKLGDLFDNEFLGDAGDTELLHNSYMRLGLHGRTGSVRCSEKTRDAINERANLAREKLGLSSHFDKWASTSLAGLNDNQIPWPEIAKIIEEFPEAFFTKPV